MKASSWLHRGTYGDSIMNFCLDLMFWRSHCYLIILCLSHIFGLIIGVCHLLIGLVRYKTQKTLLCNWFLLFGILSFLLDFFDSKKYYLILSLQTRNLYIFLLKTQTIMILFYKFLFNWFDSSYCGKITHKSWILMLWIFQYKKIVFKRTKDIILRKSYKIHNLSEWTDLNRKWLQLPCFKFSKYLNQHALKITVWPYYL